MLSTKVTSASVVLSRFTTEKLTESLCDWSYFKCLPKEWKLNKFVQRNPNYVLTFWSFLSGRLLCRDSMSSDLCHVRCQNESRSKWILEFRLCFLLLPEEGKGKCSIQPFKAFRLTKVVKIRELSREVEENLWSRWSPRNQVKVVDRWENVVAT